MDRGDIASKFLDAIEFDLYPYQEDALLAWFETEHGLLVTVPTGMGKTLVAEAAIFEALHTGKRLYYTTPLIALTDQKFREMQGRAEAWGFRREDVGLITGNRRENPEACVLIVVAEILMNHLLAADDRLAETGAVVMDEFHYFNDRERGIVWELSLVLLPPHVRLMLLSATVGNAYDFTRWLKDQHGRPLRLITSDERRVPLEYNWVGGKLVTEQLPAMLSDRDAENRAPALVFCFNRNECWEVAERVKGVKLIPASTREEIERNMDPADFADGIGPKLRQMLIRGVGVHHAGVLPKHKAVIESLFGKKLIPFVICTETLAAGINLPARSVVLGALLKGKRGEKKLMAPSSAHQMFGRAGRPQFDTHGYVYVVAHEDDVKIAKWREKYDKIDSKSKDPGIMRARKQLERKKPSRRKTEQYWTEGQFRNLIKAGPANLYSQSMIPYQFLIFMLTKTGTLHQTREFLSKRFNSPERIAKWQDQFSYMTDNLAAQGYLSRDEDGDRVTLDDSIYDLLAFRSVDPLYGAFLAELLNQGSLDEKIQALESMMIVSPSILRQVRLPEELLPGPLFENFIKPRMISLGVNISPPERDEEEEEDRPRDRFWQWDNEPEERPPTFPEMLKIAFDADLPAPEEIEVQPKWIAGALFEMDCDFYRFVRDHNLTKHEGIILRHLLRLVILAGEFLERTEDPDYRLIADQAARACQRVDPRYTDHFLSDQQEVVKLVAAS